MAPIVSSKKNLFVCVRPVNRFGKGLEMLILVWEHVLKNWVKERSSCRTLIVTAGLEGRKILGRGLRPMSQWFIIWKKTRLFLRCKIMYSNQILLHGFISNVSFLYDQSGSKISHILIFSLCVQKPLFLNSLEYRRYFLHLSQVRQYSHEFSICISYLNSISPTWFLSA